MPNLKTFSLYLAKRDVADFDDLLTENARDLLRQGTVRRSVSEEFGDASVLYIFPNYPRPPKWVVQLKPLFSIPDNILTQSSCALLAFKKGDLLFAITFSYGHVYLDDAKTEANFGLRVAINAVSDEKLRSVEHSNIGEAIRDFAQAAGQRDLRTFGFDDALDLIRKVSGRAADRGFADMVTGARALRFSKKIDVSDVPDTALEAATLFDSVAYQGTGFKIIDFLSPVLDPVQQDQLDDVLVSAIRQRSDEFEMAIPEITSDTMASFRFEHARMSDFHPDLSLELYAAGLEDRLAELSVADLKRHRVAAYFEDADIPALHWSVYNALVGSVVFNDERFALNEGLWYRVGQSFKEGADTTFDRLYVAPDPKLRTLKKVLRPKAKGKKVRSAYQSEQSYNEEVAEESGYLRLDRRLIQIDDRPGAGTEACDLLDIEGRRLIHIKKSSRQSSVLSHFFKQGGNAAQMIRKYEPFRVGMVETIRTHYGPGQARKLQSALNDRNDRWAVDFRIADFPRHNGIYNIPFFSKLTLKDEATNIESMGFDVRVGFIPLSRTS
jgi:uncharacterized protein (TIGR04141 family)